MSTFDYLRTRAVAFALALAASLLVLAGPVTKPAKTQDGPPSTLDGEMLDAETARNFLDRIDRPGEVTVEAVNCSIDENQGTGTISYTATGDAVGPYPGTFTETGTFTLGDAPPDASLPGQRTITSFTAEFEIDSPTTGTRITGTKSAENVPLIARCYELEGTNLPGTAQVRIAVPGAGEVPVTTYEAKIETSAATFVDRGTAYVFLREVSFSDGDTSGELINFSEGYVSSLLQPAPLGLTKEQCDDGGYERFGFKNQGDCVSFVATEGSNEPGKNQQT
jgi:hypothetical protein